MMTAEFRPYAQIAPAPYPLHTPDEALEELIRGRQRASNDHLRGNQERPIPSARGIDPQKAAWYCDTIALDSPMTTTALATVRRTGCVTNTQAAAVAGSAPSATHLQHVGLSPIESRLRRGVSRGLVHRYQASILASWKAE